MGDPEFVTSAETLLELGIPAASAGSTQNEEVHSKEETPEWDKRCAVNRDGKSHRDGQCPIPGGVQEQVGWSHGQPDLVPGLEVNNTACGRGLEVNDLWGFFQTNCSVILL